MNAPDVDTHLGYEILGQGSDRNAIPAAARAFLAEGRAHLEALHRAGGRGSEVNEAHSDLIDALVRRLFELSEGRYFEEGGEGPSEFCVVAVGGYARREMNVHSDVDLLFLYRDQVTPYVKAVAEQLQMWLWDSQVTVGGATRTINDTIRLARDDVSVCTALLAPRFLAGSGILFHQFTRLVQTRLLDKPEAFIADQIVAMHERHTQYGDSLYLLQPNIKEGAGGLRDYHAAFWAMQAALPGARSREDFLHQGLLTFDEVAAARDALDFQWRVRNELHLHMGRKHDQLSFDLQEHVANAFGYEPEHEDGLAVETLMGDYYRHARDLLNCSSLVLEQCLARVRQKPRRRRVQHVEEGLRIADGQLEIPHARQLRDDPILLLRTFHVAQRHDVPLTRKARRLITENLDLIDDEYRSNPAAAAAFFEILGAERRVTRSLITMNEVGLLGTLLPEWEHIVNRWQHVMYHTYTVDVHSIFLVEEMRRLWKGDYEKELPVLTSMIRDTEDLLPLYLGCLCHDLGKGLGGNHSPKGAVRSRAMLERMGVDDELIQTVEFLVEEHLVMSHIAQRRDLSDPRLVLEFARTVGSRKRLRLLYLLTVADIRASSKKAWTRWKGSLLHELFERTAELLETGADDTETAMELVERRVETRRQAASEELAKQGRDAAEIDDYFEMMPRRYFTAHTPTQIARHAAVVLDRGSDDVAHGRKEMRGGFTEFIVCTKDTPGLFSNVAGVLTAHHMNILGAHVYTTRSGLALEVYRVATPNGDERARDAVWRDLLASLERVLRGADGVEELLARRGRPLGFTTTPSRKPESVEISNDESDFYTIVDVAANDRLGLLHDLTRVIAKHGYEIYISKAGKVLDQVTDAFYIKHEGQKIKDPEALEALRRELLEALRNGGARGSA